MSDSSFQGMSDTLVHDELCRRLKAARLESNVTQAELAEKAGVSLITVKRAESGRGNITLMTLIALLRGLGQLEQLARFLPQPALRPLQMKPVEKRGRQRASSRSSEAKPAADWVWGDES